MILQDSMDHQTLSGASMSLIQKEDSQMSCETVHVRFSIPDVEQQTILVLNVDESVWMVKQKLLSTIGKGVKDGINYGLYCPACNGKAGKFLDEERPLRDYPLPKPIGYLEFKPKKRLYRLADCNQKSMRKINTVHNQRRMMELVGKMDVEKVTTLLNLGLDPNFSMSDKTGSTPMTLAASLHSPRAMLLALVGGGAFIDYRNKQGLTPLHVAAQLGNKEALRALLDLGGSPNYKDSKGLTPLYHCVLSDGGAECVYMLLHERAELDVTNERGWTELHQSCKFARYQLLEHLVFYGADINAQTDTGDTPLHICARYGEAECAKILLRRGANKTLRNSSDEECTTLAEKSDHSLLAQYILTFRPGSVELYDKMPSYNEKRRGSISIATLRNLQRSRSNPDLTGLFQQLANPHYSSLSSARGYQYLNGGFVNKQSANGSVSGASAIGKESGENSITRWIHNTRVVSLKKDRYGYGFVIRGAKCFRSSTVSSSVSLYSDDRDDIRDNEIPMTQTAARNGYVGSQPILVLPRLVQIVSLFLPLLRGGSSPILWGPSLDAPTADGGSFGTGRGFGTKLNFLGNHQSCLMPGMKLIQHHSGQLAQNPSITALDFIPTARVPALQYFDHIEKGSPAEAVGLAAGDFLIEINDQSVTRSAHEHVVRLIRDTVGVLKVKVITVVTVEDKRSNNPQGQTVKESPRISNKRQAPAPPGDRKGSVSHSLASGTVSTLSGLEELEILDEALAQYEDESASMVSTTSAHRHIYGATRTPLNQNITLNNEPTPSQSSRIPPDPLPDYEEEMEASGTISRFEPHNRNEMEGLGQYDRSMGLHWRTIPGLSGTDMGQVYSDTVRSRIPTPPPLPPIPAAKSQNTEERLEDAVVPVVELDPMKRLLAENRVEIMEAVRRRREKIDSMIIEQENQNDAIILRHKTTTADRPTSNISDILNRSRAGADEIDTQYLNGSTENQNRMRPVSQYPPIADENNTLRVAKKTSVIYKSLPSVNTSIKSNNTSEVNNSPEITEENPNTTIYPRKPSNNNSTNKNAHVDSKSAANEDTADENIGYLAAAEKARKEYLLRQATWRLAKQNSFNKSCEDVSQKQNESKIGASTLSLDNNKLRDKNENDNKNTLITKNQTLKNDELKVEANDRAIIAKVEYNSSTNVLNSPNTEIKPEKKEILSSVLSSAQTSNNNDILPSKTPETAVVSKINIAPTEITTKVITTTSNSTPSVPASTNNVSKAVLPDKQVPNKIPSSPVTPGLGENSKIFYPAKPFSSNCATKVNESEDLKESDVILIGSAVPLRGGASGGRVLIRSAYQGLESNTNRYSSTKNINTNTSGIQEVKNTPSNNANKTPITVDTIVTQTTTTAKTKTITGGIPEKLSSGNATLNGSISDVVDVKGSSTKYPSKNIPANKTNNEKPVLSGNNQSTLRHDSQVNHSAANVKPEQNTKNNSSTEELNKTADKPEILRNPNYNNNPLERLSQLNSELVERKSHSTIFRARVSQPVIIQLDRSAITKSRVVDWTVDDVAQWLDSFDFGTYKETFRGRGIDGAKLLKLGQRDLVEMGVTSLLNQIKIEKEIKKLKNVQNGVNEAK